MTAHISPRLHPSPSPPPTPSQRRTKQAQPWNLLCRPAGYLRGLPDPYLCHAGLQGSRASRPSCQVRRQLPDYIDCQESPDRIAIRLRSETHLIDEGHAKLGTPLRDSFPRGEDAA